MSVVALLVDHPLLAPISEQRADSEALSAAQFTEVAPRTAEDWHYQLRHALAELSADDVVVVHSLNSLGVTSDQLFDGLAAVGDARVKFVAIAEHIDTREDDSFLSHARQLHDAIDSGRLAIARELIANASSRDTVSPPKAEFVDLALWEQIEGR